MCYYAFNGELQLSKSEDYSWWRPIPPYELYIRTGIEDQDGTPGSVEVIAVTQNIQNGSTECYHQEFILNFTETSADMYAVLAKGEDEERMNALGALLAEEDRKFLTSEEAGLSLRSFLESAGMKVCMEQKWMRDIIIPTVPVTIESVDVDRLYPVILLCCEKQNGSFFDMDMEYDLICYLSEKKLRQLEGILFDSTYVRGSRKLNQLARFIIYKSILNGKEAIKRRELTDMDARFLCFQNEDYHWGVFVPEGSAVTEETAVAIMDEADPEKIEII